MFQKLTEVKIDMVGKESALRLVQKQMDTPNHLNYISFLRKLIEESFYFDEILCYTWFILCNYFEMWSE